MGAHSNLGVFSDAQEISAAGYSTNFIDMAVTTPQIGVGKPLYLCIRTAVAPTEAADTISIELQCSATNDGSNLDGTVKTVMMIADAAGSEITVSDARFATAGAWIYRGTIPYECNLRYVQLYYNNSTSTGTCTYDAWLDDKPQSDFGVQVTDSPVGNP